MALLALAVSTMEKYRKSPAQTQAQLNNVWQPEGQLPPPMRVIPMTLP
jgi:hypothetical protein